MDDDEIEILKGKQIAALEKAIKVWEHIASLPPEIVEQEEFWQWKYEKVYKALRFKRKLPEDIDASMQYPRFGCPLCEVFFDTPNCPLGNCDSEDGCVCEFHYSYGEWMTNAHDQELAQRFLDELKDVMQELVGDCDV